MKMGLIYKHTNIINGHSYIGSTIQNPTRRWRKTDKTYSSYKNCPVFYAALQKYGWDNFKTTILEDNVSFQDISIKEELYIKQFNTIAPNGYNTVKIIDGRVEFTDTTKKKISESKKNYYNSLDKPIIAYNRNHHVILDNLPAKKCTECKIVKHLIDYGKYVSNWDKLHWICKVCHAKRSADYRLKNPITKLNQDELKVSYQNRKTVSRPLMATNPVTNEILLFKSGKDAYKLKFYKNSIKHSIKNKTLYKGYFWKFTDEPTKVFARKCQIKEIDVKEEKEFLNKYHKQGWAASSICYGLYYQDKLALVLSFGKPRFNKKYQWEIIRLCTEPGLIVVGGASKLLAYFIKTYSPENIMTYADKDYSKQGDVYLKLGFRYVNDTKPGYGYKKDNVFLPRYKCQKHKLEKLLGIKYNPNITESENMKQAGYTKILDSGHKIYELILS